MLGALAQAKEVHIPSVMYFAGIKLELSPALRAELKQEVEKLHTGGIYFDQKLNRVYTYMPIIEQVMKEQGLPDDFKYLPIQESSLLGHVVSSSNAVGFWQFKKATGVEVGLRIDHNIDERMSIIASTRGAANYLKKNNRYLDNWVNALLSYYAGLGGAQRYIHKRDKGATVMKVTPKLHWYVKKTLAHKLAFEPFLEAMPPQKYYLQRYKQGQGKTMKQVAHNLGVDEETLQSYNLWLKRGRVPTQGVYEFVYPVEGPSRQMDYMAKKTHENGENTPPQIKSYPRWRGIASRIKRINGIRGVVAQSGDDITALATLGKISEIKFITYNDIPAHRTINKGEIFYFKRKHRRADKGVEFHTAQYGETMWDIAQHYGIRLKSLLKLNRMRDFDQLKAGRVIHLRKKRKSREAIIYHQVEKNQPVVTEKKQQAAPKPKQKKTTYRETKKEVAVKKKQKATPAEPAPAPVIDRSVTSDYYTVQKGDTFYAISREFDIPVPELLALNQLSSGAVLSIGQRLKVTKTKQEVAPKAAPEKSAQPQQKVHIVEKGETLYKIARMNNVSVQDILKWNNKPTAELEIGERIVLFLLHD